MLLEDVEKVKSKVNNTYEEKKTMKANIAEKKISGRKDNKKPDNQDDKITSPATDDSDPLYRKMILQARTAFPYAQSDAHALMRYFQDIEKRDKASLEFLKLEQEDQQKQINVLKREIDEIKKHTGAKTGATGFGRRATDKFPKGTTKRRQWAIPKAGRQPGPSASGSI